MEGISSKPVSASGRNNVSYVDKELLQPFISFEKNQSSYKRWQIVAEHCFNYWFETPKDIQVKFRDIFQLLTSSCLILDDLCDGSPIRQGVPVVHLIYGIPSTLAAVKYSLAVALEKLVEFNEPKLLDVYIEGMIKTHRGQGFEIYWRNTRRCPTEEQYFEMALGKTSEVVIMVNQMMQVFSDWKEDLSVPFNMLSMATQLANDYVNLYSPEYSSSKGSYDDITTGTFTLPLIHAIQNGPKHSKVLAIMRLRTKCDDIKKYCLSLLKEQGSFEYTQKKIQELAEKASNEFKKFPENPILEEFLEVLMQPINSETAQLLVV